MIIEGINDLQSYVVWWSKSFHDVFDPLELGWTMRRVDWCEGKAGSEQEQFNGKTAVPGRRVIGSIIKEEVITRCVRGCSMYQRYLGWRKARRTMPRCSAIWLDLEDPEVLSKILKLLLYCCSLTGGCRTRTFGGVFVYGCKLRLQLFDALSQQLILSL